MRYLLDTSAVLAHSRGELGAEIVQQLFEQEDTSLLLSSLTLAELARRLGELGASPDEAWAQITGYRQAIDEIVPVDEDVARESDRLRLSSTTRLPLVDTLIAASASTRQAVLVHRDDHMRGLRADLVKQMDLDAP